MLRLPQGYYALQVPIPNNPLGFLLSYLIEGKNGHTLIDTGWNAPEAYESLVAQLGTLGVSLKDIRQIILTHMHPDHSGLANQIRRESGATVFSHRLESLTANQHQAMMRFANAEAGYSPLRAFGVPPQMLQNTRFGRGGGHRMNLPEPDVLLNGDETIDVGTTELEVIWTPGHAEGHICLYDRRNRILLSGDHVLPITTPNVNLLRGSGEKFDPLGDYLASIEKLKPLEVDVVLPAHDHIFEDLTGRLKEMQHHHDGRLVEMKEASAEHWKSAFEVARKINWTIGSFDTFDNGTKIMAVGESLAHLEYLQRQGQIEKKIDDGVILYYSIK